MQAQSSPRQATNVWAWVIAAAGVILMVLLLLSFVADSQRPSTSEVAGTTSNRVAYLQFGLTSDTLWRADATAPDQRERLLTIPHAAEYGILPALSPDGSRFAYTALPENTHAPGPDSPAQLWLATIASDAPRLLAEDVDLLVPPIWTPDGESVVYRRSEMGTHTLATGKVDGDEERILAYSETEALFPLGFRNGGTDMLYLGISQGAGSIVYSVDLATGVAEEVSRLSTGLTRDWALSPDATRLAFLEIAISESEVASRASVLDLATGAIQPMTQPGEVAFSPVWSDTNELAIGLFSPSTSEATLLLIDGKERTRIAGPESGFYVPLAYSQTAGAYLVTAFENDSIVSPGRSSLVLIPAAADGERITLAEGEVTLVGWTHP